MRPGDIVTGNGGEFIGTILDTDIMDGLPVALVSCKCCTAAIVAPCDGLTVIQSAVDSFIQSAQYIANN